MIDFTENEDGSITYESSDGRVTGRCVGTLAVRHDPFSFSWRIYCEHCDREISPLRKVWVVDDLSTGRRVVPIRSWESALVFADSASLEGIGRTGITGDAVVWICQQDLAELQHGKVFQPLRQWRRERDLASNSEPKMRL